MTERRVDLGPPPTLPTPAEMLADRRDARLKARWRMRGPSLRRWGELGYHKKFLPVELSTRQLAAFILDLSIIVEGDCKAEFLAAWTSFERVAALRRLRGCLGAREEAHRAQRRMEKQERSVERKVEKRLGIGAPQARMPGQ